MKRFMYPQAAGKNVKPSNRLDDEPHSDHFEPDLLERPDFSGATGPVLNQGNLLSLQRSIGNQAVQRLIKQKQGSQPVQRITPQPVFQAKAGPAANSLCATGPVIQRVLSYSAFERGWKKKAKGVGIDIFDHVRAQDLHLDPKGQKAKLGKANIIDAFKLYDQEKSVSALSELFHTINYWETLNNINASEAWHQPAMEYLANQKEKIKDKVKKMTNKQHDKPSFMKLFGRSNQSRQANKIGKDLAAKSKERRVMAEMPDFLKEVGVSHQYFANHLMGHDKRIDSLRKFYTALKDGKMNEAQAAFEDVKDVPGMKFMIKPLFMSYFTQNKYLEKLVGTDAQSEVGKDLTNEEKVAINLYAGSAFDAMNNQLRDTGEAKKVARPTQTEINNDSLEGTTNKLEAFKRYRKEKEQRQKLQGTMEDVVSGLNKLPKFSGISYRGLKNVPEGYMENMHPGATLSTLGFSSASPSFDGVRHYLNVSAGDGTRYVFFMIHTKTAVNIVEQAGIKAEAEVLFRPGTRFKVKGLWQYQDGKVPKEAPAEVQMILHSTGEHKSEVTNRAALSGLSPEEYKNKVNLADQNDKFLKTLKWNKVKVIEMVEV